MSVLGVHAEMVRCCQDTGITSNAFLVDIESTWNVVFEFFVLVCHAVKLKQSAGHVILSFGHKAASSVHL